VKFAGRALRTVLAAVLFAGPAAAQMRGASVGSVQPLSAVSAAISAPSAMTLGGASVAQPSAALSASLPAGSPLAAAPAAAAAVPAALPVALTPAVLPALAPAAAAVRPSVVRSALRSAASAAPAPASALREMRDLPAAASGRAFDGASGKNAAAAPADDADGPETLPIDAAEAAVVQMPELFITKESKLGIKKGQLTSHVGLIKSKGSEWYWGKFKKGELIALKSGSQTMFVTRVEGAKTIKIASMQRADFEGLFSAQRMAGKTIAQLRNAMVQDLKDRQARRPGAPTPVSSQSEVRLVRFTSSIKARQLPENKDESAYPAAPRAAVELPAAMQGLNHLLPKTVLVDMRLFPNGMPYPLIEDMTKLMKTGVYFVLLSDKPNDGPGSVEDLLTKQLSIKQRDQISRYKMVILSDNGNSMSGYSGNFSKPLPSVRFTQQQLEIMEYVAQARGVAVAARTTRVDMVLPSGADVEQSRAGLFEAMRGMSLNPAQWQWSVSERDGKTVVTVRPQSLVSAIPHLLEVMREHEGVFANNSDLMVISRDAALLGALPGSVQPSAHLASDGVQLADESLAALLGPYRENKPGDLAASASKISSFIQNPNRGFGNFGNVYMMTGHIMHSAFNWAVWRYRNTGVLPSAEETVEIARGIWEHEARGSAKNLLGRPGESLAGFYETVEMRLRAMHSVAAEVLKVYPIAIGTELANMVVVERFKKGAPDRRDIFRLIFDFVVARKTADGKLETAIVDFKTGQVPTLQSLEKDTQVQLYDLLVRQMWKDLPVLYGATGDRIPVSDYKLFFVYTAGAYQPNLNDKSRRKFNKFLNDVMNRIRRHNAPPAPKDAKAVAKKAAPKGKADAKPAPAAKKS
jgi:hypothetical protein